MIYSIYEADLEHKNVLVRADLNVPMDNNGNILDAHKIKSSLLTIDEIIDKGGIPILISHLGRPKGEKNSKYSLKPIADYLSNVFGYDVLFADDCIGQIAKEVISNAHLGQIVLLENLRFYNDEEANSANFAKKLAELGDVFVNDAFGTAHRAHASTEAIAKYFPERYAGALMISELDYLGNTLSKPLKPFTVIMGGSKISGKIDVIRQLFKKCENILIGGGMMFTFLKAKGYEVGNSLCEPDKVELANELIAEAKSLNINLVLPTDVIVAEEFKNDAINKITSVENIPVDMFGMDIGPETSKNYASIILKSNTLFWNGPMGVFEMSNFLNGTLSIAEAIAEATSKGAISVVGGGDSASAIIQHNYENKVTHVSTGGGASLEFLEGKELPGIKALERE